jgi:hypothetical protein
MKNMIRSGFALFSLYLIMAACTPAPVLTPTPEATATAIPAASLPTMTARLEPTATQQPDLGEVFSKISRSSDALHMKCDPQEIIFDVTVKSADVQEVAFFFRMKDKVTGLVNPWSKGENMRSAGSNIFEFIFKASAIPEEARYKQGWVQYQFVGIDKNKQSIGHSQIFSKDLSFTISCP